MGLTGEMMLPEFDHEMASTRKTLERIPDDKLDWQPHAKSMTVRALATHLANLVGWTVQVIGKDSIDVAPGGEQLMAEPVNSRAEALEMFDRNVHAAREAIAGAGDEHMKKPWTLQANGKTIFTQPRAACLRGFVINHTIHHRAQMGVYLRLNDIPVPSVYGPSADEGIM